ncbi:NotI family restriction endonuclease [Hoeflea sp.]|uniref:NotI family restriction endonuclease n=1 Tax=Hoeflea sp. TaxID=1940281 RepID=UPI003B02DC4F
MSDDDIERFHIAEWYGLPFADLTDKQRAEFARYKVGKVMPKAEIERLEALEAKSASGSLTKTEEKRLDHLAAKLESQNSRLKPCPFRTDIRDPVCTKAGGVCSLRLYSGADDKIGEVAGKRGRIRALCPYRFHQDDIVFQDIGQALLGDANPVQIAAILILAHFWVSDEFELIFRRV